MTLLRPANVIETVLYREFDKSDAVSDEQRRPTRSLHRITPVIIYYHCRPCFARVYTYSHTQMKTVHRIPVPLIRIYIYIYTTKKLNYRIFNFSRNKARAVLSLKSTASLSNYSDKTIVDRRRIYRLPTLHALQP